MPYQTTGRAKRSFSGRKRAFSYPTNKTGRGGRTKDNINPSRFIKAARPVEAETYNPENAFQDFDINYLLQENLEAKGIQTPSPIQDKAIPLGLSGRDVIGIANTGTGKTIAFALPVLHKVMGDPASSVLIMAPTRELAQQIEAEFKTIAKGSGMFGAVLIGGAPMMQQLRDLARHPSIVIGTPGRIKDHVERGSLKLNTFNTVVLDEVDRMLDMGFIIDMRFILSRLATPRQSYFFSATLSNEVSQLIREFSADPALVSVKTGDTTDSVEQNIVSYRSSHEKPEKLHDILIADVNAKVIVFDDTQRAVERLSKELVDRGFAADAIHGGKTQGQRQRALKNFRDNKISILVATDVAARGIDITDITHVINYSTPKTYDDYVHRIGRAGRAGRTGKALTFVQE